MKTKLLAVALMFVCATAQAELILNIAPESFAQTLFYGKGPSPYWTKTYQPLTPHTNRTGRAILSTDQSTLTLENIGFTRPAHTYDFTNQTVRVEVSVAEQRWELPHAVRDVTYNIAGELTTVPFKTSDFISDDDFKGTYRLTGFEGSVVEGSFNFGNLAHQTGTFGRDWDVGGRDGNPIIGDVNELTGRIGLTTQGYGNIWSGNIDGIDFDFEYHGQSNQYDLSSAFTSAVPEPSGAAVLMLATGIGFIHRRKAIVSV